MVLVRCAIVGDSRIFTVDFDSEDAVVSLKDEIQELAGFQFPAAYLTLYQAKQFGIEDSAWLTTRHPDYEELARGNKQVEAVYLTENLLMHPARPVDEYIPTPPGECGEDVIHVLVKLPTAEQVQATKALRCAIVGDRRIFTIDFDAEDAVGFMKNEIQERAGFDHPAAYLTFYQAKQFGIEDGAWLTTSHLDYEELARGNEQVEAVYLTEQLLMHPVTPVSQYIPVDTEDAENVIHVLVKRPTAEYLKARADWFTAASPATPPPPTTRVAESGLQCLIKSLFWSAASYFDPHSHDKKND